MCLNIQRKISRPIGKCLLPIFRITIFVIPSMSLSPHPFPEVFGRNGLDFGADHFKTTPPPHFLLIYPYPTQNKL